MRRPASFTQLLRWYPRSWRDRYGDEFVALMEDTFRDERPTLATRCSIARAGLVERSRAGGWAGDSASPEDRVRAGALLVMWAWASVVVVGAAFAKMSEHFVTSLPPSGGATAIDAWRAVEVAAGAATIATLAGAIAAVPAFLRARRERRLVGLHAGAIRAVAASSVAIAATAGLVRLAHTLPVGTREAGVGAYGLAFVAWAALMGLTTVTWTSLAVALARRVDFTRTELAVEAVLAVAVGLSVLVIGASIALWWHAMATAAPWFLQGAPAGSRTSAFDLRLLAILIVAIASAVTSGYGIERVARSWTGVDAA